MDRQGVVRELERRKARKGSWRAVALELKVSEQYVHDVKEGRRKPGTKILDPMGLELRETYVAKKEKIA